jgi:TP901 family phage tail tape measure protein
MNSLMLIQVRVQLAQANRQIATLQRQMGMLQAQTRRTNAAMAGGFFGGRTQAFSNITRMGNRLQWVGRQLQYNFTLPIALAGIAGTKFALDNEKAMTRIIKVYGDGSKAFRHLTKTEIPALGRAFEALSNRFGVARADVINIAADWAAAGASGLALAKSTKLTMETMMLGEMDATQATRALISIQAQFGLQVDANKKGVMDLSKVVDILNMTENQTGTTLNDLVISMARSAGTARTATVDIRHLAAMTAALVPAAGTASEAGNALKTILSRIIHPTGQASDAMKALGINTDSAAYAALSGSAKVEVLAKHFAALSDSQQSVAATLIAGRWQLNRFSILMRAVNSQNSYYAKALRATSSEAANYAQKQKELNTVLNSSPQRLKIIWTSMQNALADIVQPMLPAILALAQGIAHLVTGFSNLAPSTQKLIGLGLIFLALVGPITRYVGALISLFGLLGDAVVVLGVIVGKLGGLLLKLLIPLKGLGKLVWAAARGVVAAAAAMWTAVSAMLPRLAAMLASSLELVVVWVGVTGLTILQGMTRMLETVMLAIGAFASRVMFSTLLPVLTSAFQTLALQAMYAFEAVMSGIGTIMTGIGVLMLEGMAAIQRAWAAAWSAIETGVLAIWYGIERLWVFTMAALENITVTSLAVIQATTAAFGRSFALLWLAIRVATVGIWAGLWRVLANPAFYLGILTMTASMFTGLRTLFARAVPFLITLFTSPWTYAVLAIGAAIGAIQSNVAGGMTGILRWLQGLGSDLARIFAPVVSFFQRMGDDIVAAFNKLPEGIQNAIMAVVRIVAWGAEQVYKLFTYLDPFATHSPSLVDQVTKGMGVIRNQYGHMRGVGQIMRKTANDVAAFKRQTAQLAPGQFADQRTDVRKAFPAAVPQFDRLVNDYHALNAAMGKAQVLVNAQQNVVDGWQEALDRANVSLETQQKTLDGLQSHLDALKNKYQNAQQSMQNFANAPIKGMDRFDNAIFRNDQAQNKLQLRMLKWQMANGSIDSISNKMSSMAGELEKLRGEATHLRLAGAGSDVLGPVNQQIELMQKNYNKLNKSSQSNPLAAMQQELDLLDQQNQALNLQKNIKFDPLIRQIQRLSDTQKALSYEQIIAGILREKAAMADLRPQIQNATRAVNDQQKAVDRATAARDRVQSSYDAESKQLQRLQDRYQKISDAVNGVTDSLDAMGSAASQALQKLAASKKDATTVKDATKKTPPVLGPVANLPDVGGNARIGREGGMKDQSKMIDRFTKRIQDEATKAFGGFGDMFAPIKHGWNVAWAWVKKNVGPVMADLGHAIAAGVHGIGDVIRGTAQSDFGKRLHSIFTSLGKTIVNVFHAIGAIVKLFWPDIQRLFKGLWDIAQAIWKNLVPSLVKLWNSIQPVAAIIGGVLLLVLKVAAEILTRVVIPAIIDVIKIASNLINAVADVARIIGDVFKLINDLIHGRWSKAWHDFLDIFSSAWDYVTNIASAAWKIIKGVFANIIRIARAFVGGIIDFFQWLWNVLVGHSIIPDLVKKILYWWNWLIKPFKVVLSAIWKALKAAWDTIKNIAVTLFNWFRDTWSRNWERVKGWFTGPIDAARDVIKNIIGAVKDTFWTVVHWVGSTFKSAWNKIKDIFLSPIRAAKSVLSSLLDDIKGFFRNFVNGIGPVWDRLEHILKVPIRFFTHVIYHDGLEWLWNKIVGAIGMRDTLGLPDPPKGWATGGVVPGYQPGMDTIPAMLSKGEGILRPEVVRELGPSTIDRWNRDRRISNFAGGGIIGDIGGFLGSLGSALNPAKAINWVKDKFSAVLGQMDRFSDTKFGRLVTGLPKALIGGLVSKLGDVFTNLAAADTRGVSGTYYSALPKALIDDFRIFEMGTRNMTLQGVMAILNDLTFLLRGLRVTAPGGGLSNGLDQGLGLKSSNPVYVGGQWGYITSLSDPAARWVRSNPPATGVNAPQVKSMTLGRLSQMGWSAANVDALGRLWDGESGWRWNAMNPGSGAYGIPQALPGNKMASAGADWRTNPQTQINWGLSYIAGRYGSASNAYSQWLSRDPHWYAKGGIANRPTLGVFGEAGREVLAPLDPLWNKLNRLEARVTSVQRSTGGDTIININGNLEFPNINSGDDAKDFIKNLKRAASTR